MRFLAIIFFLVPAAMALAQTRPSSGAMYFQHQYLANPAMGGIDSGLSIYVAHRQQTGGIDGAPSAQALAATYQLGGFRLGVLAGNDRIGIFNTARASASVSYSQPLGSNNQLLHLGISFGGYDLDVRGKQVQGDIDDPVLQQFNNQNLVYDGDLGLAYTDTRLTVQASLIGFANALKEGGHDPASQMRFFTAASYKIAPEDLPVSEIIPKACYRLFRDGGGVADFGGRINFGKYRFGVEAMYHTNSAVTMGVNVSVLSKLNVLFLYSSEPPESRPYTKGNIEFGLKTMF